jgi:glutathione S-transferase
MRRVGFASGDGACAAPEHYAGAKARRDVADTAHRTLADLFANTEARLAGCEWVAGPMLSVADLYLLFFWLWGPRMVPDAEDLSHCPVWSAILRRLLTQTVIARIVREEGLFPDNDGAGGGK